MATGQPHWAYQPTVCIIFGAAKRQVLQLAKRSLLILCLCTHVCLQAIDAAVTSYWNKHNRGVSASLPAC
jgi:hypothetical protein